MFKKIVAIEPVGLMPKAEQQLHHYGQKIIMHRDIPSTSEEIIARIGDADAILVNYTSTIDKTILSQCPNLKYVGMCCSLYSPESANVDIKYAGSIGITVKGIRDYGDEGVVEYVMRELISCLHGYGNHKQGKPLDPWHGQSREITGLKAGIIGLGKSGGMIADALKFFGADISYFSRNKNRDAQEKGYKYLNLNRLLSKSEVVFTCLPKNTILLNEEEFKSFGEGKILFNTGLAPTWAKDAFQKWIAKNNRLYCDSIEALGTKNLLTHENVFCLEVSSGRTVQAYERLSKKVLDNLSEFNRRSNVS